MEKNNINEEKKVQEENPTTKIDSKELSEEPLKTEDNFQSGLYDGESQEGAPPAATGSEEAFAAPLEASKEEGIAQDHEAESAEGTADLQTNQEDTVAFLLAEGEKFINQGELTNAWTCYEEVLRLDPTNVEAVNKQGVVCSRKEDYEEAIKYFEKAVQMDPTYYKALGNIGNMYYQKGDLKEAEKYYGEAIALNGEDATYLNNMAVVKRYTGDYSGYLKYYRRAMKMDRKHPTNKPYRKETEKKRFIVMAATWAVVIIVFYLIFMR